MVFQVAVDSVGCAKYFRCSRRPLRCYVEQCGTTMFVAVSLWLFCSYSRAVFEPAIPKLLSHGAVALLETYLAPLWPVSLLVCDVSTCRRPRVVAAAAPRRLCAVGSLKFLVIFNQFQLKSLDIA